MHNVVLGKQQKQLEDYDLQIGWQRKKTIDDFSRILHEIYHKAAVFVLTAFHLTKVYIDVSTSN